MILRVAPAVVAARRRRGRQCLGDAGGEQVGAGLHLSPESGMTQHSLGGRPDRPTRGGLLGGDVGNKKRAKMFATLS
jgi:hypothetical protein